MKTCLCFLLLAAVAAVPVPVPAETQSNADPEAPPSYSTWKRGVPADPGYFPIAVWLQSPHNAGKYKAAGINLYVGLWRGPTTSQLEELKAAGMQVICTQNKVGLEHSDSPVIAGWMHDDEPDNAQALPSGQGWGPPVLPQKIERDYERIRAADQTRPVLLNLGQGVAWDNYIGRGVRRNRPEDYPEYIKGSDIVSFDIYPVVHDAPEIAGKLDFVAKGVERLVQWSGGRKIVWNCIECTHISNPDTKATPSQVRSEVWMALIHGSRGIIYFVHQFKPTFKEAALLDDPEMLGSVTALNRRIHGLAPALNSASVKTGVTVTSASSNQNTPRIAWMQKHAGGKVFLFTVNMASEPVRVGISIDAAVGGTRSVEVLDESRDLSVSEGKFTDAFGPYEVHLYALRP